MKAVKVTCVIAAIAVLSGCGSRHHFEEEVSRTSMAKTEKGYSPSLVRTEFYKGETNNSTVNLYANDVYLRTYEEYSYDKVIYRDKYITEPNLLAIVASVGFICLIDPSACFGEYGDWDSYDTTENKKKVNSYTKKEVQVSDQSQSFQLFIDGQKTINSATIYPQNGVFRLDMSELLRKTAQRPHSITVKTNNQHGDKTFAYAVQNQELQKFTTASWLKTKQKALHAGKIEWNDFMHEVNLLRSYQEKVHYALDSYLYLNNDKAATKLAMKVSPPYTYNSRKSIKKVYQHLIQQKQYSSALPIATNLWNDKKDNESKQQLFDILLTLRKFDKAEALLSKDDIKLKRQLSELRDASLPKSIRKDKYLKLLARELGDKDWEGSLYYCKQLRKLNIKLPGSVDYFQGESLYHQGRKDLAQTYLLRYANLGSQARYYNKTIDLLNQISGI